MNTHLRTAADSDYDIIASWVPHADACRRWAGPLLPFPFAASNLKALLAVAGGASYTLVDASGALCGFGQHWVVQPGAVHLGRIIVAPQARGQGHGRALFETLLAAALHSTSAVVATLRVYRDNAAAVALYSSLGFVESASESTRDVQFMRWSCP